MVSDSEAREVALSERVRKREDVFRVGARVRMRGMRGAGVMTSSPLVRITWVADLRTSVSGQECWLVGSAALCVSGT